MDKKRALQLSQGLCVCWVVSAWLGCGGGHGESSESATEGSSTTSEGSSTSTSTGEMSTTSITTEGSGSEGGTEANTTSTTGDSTTLSSSSGEMVVCEPGAVEEIPYSGPAGTLGKGICKAGKLQCNAEGTEWEMVAEVLPQVEDCSNQLDENCDGVVSCDGKGEWVMQFGEKQGGEVGKFYPYGGVEVDPWGRVWVVGEFEGSLQLGAKEWSAKNPGNFVALRVDGKDSIGWSWASGSATETEQGFALAVNDTGKVALGIWLLNSENGDGGPSVDLGPGVDSPLHVGLDEFGDHSAVVGMLTGEGQYQWSQLWIESQTQIYVQDMAFDSLGNVWATGSFRGGNVNVGTVEKPKFLINQGDYDYFVVKMSAEGEVLWAQSFGDGEEQNLISMALDQENKVWLAGELQGKVDFGNGVKLDGGVGDQGDMFVVKLDAEGKGIWGKQWGDGEEQRFRDVVVDPEGNGILVGEYKGQVANLAPQPLKNANIINNEVYSDAVIVKINGQDGQVMWVEDVKQKNSASLDFVAIDDAGHVVVVGMVLGTGTMTLGGATVAGVGSGYDVVVAKLTGETKDVLWSPRVYNTSNGGVYDVAVGALGEIYIVGDFEGETDFGPAGKLNVGVGDDSDGFLLKLRP